LAGWHVHRAVETGNWFAYKGASEPIAEQRQEALPQAPPQGAFAAITDELSSETLILYQDVALPAGKSEKLSLLAYFNSSKSIAVPPSGTLSVDEGVLEGNANQQYRIDVMKPEAALESVDPSDILRPVFRTAPRSKAMPPTRLAADLSAFAGQTVRLRFAVAAHEELLTAGVDDVSISSDPSSSPPRGSDRFSIGKAKLNRRNGTAVLPVEVPGSGLLKAKDAGTAKSASAAASKATKRPKLIRPVTVKVAQAGIVGLRLRPTNAARGVLELKQKLRVRVAVTYTPTGGSPRTATVPVVLKLEPRPRQQR
jgi:hypothetical protein